MTPKRVCWFPRPRARKDPRGEIKKVKIPKRTWETETQYAAMLNLMLKAGEIEGYKAQAFKVRLADNTWYTPDFMVHYHSHVEVHEIKGGWITDKGKIKFKIARDLWPIYDWRMMQGKKRKGVYEWTDITENLY